MIAEAIKVAEEYGMTDGAHHKQWVIDQMLRELLNTRYVAWRKKHPNWDEGIAP